MVFVMLKDWLPILQLLVSGVIAFCVAKYVTARAGHELQRRNVRADTVATAQLLLDDLWNAWWDYRSQPDRDSAREASIVHKAKKLSSQISLVLQLIDVDGKRCFDAKAEKLTSTFLTLKSATTDTPFASPKDYTTVHEYQVDRTYRTLTLQLIECRTRLYDPGSTRV